MKAIKLITVLLLMLIVSSCDKEKDSVVIITTTFGEIHVLLYDETPKHKENFLKLTTEGYYDSTTFHRIITEFMIQGGDANSKDDDPNNDGQGGPGYTIPAEMNAKYIHKKGAVAAARMGDNVNPNRESSGSQFYIVQGRKYSAAKLDQMEENANMQTKNQLLSEYIMKPENSSDLAELRRYQDNKNQDSINLFLDRIRPIAEKGFEPFKYTDEQRKAYEEVGGTPHLDGGYTVFGEVIRGIEVVDEIAKQPKTRGDRPVKDVKMSVKIEVMKRSKIEEEYGYQYPAVPEEVK